MAPPPLPPDPADRALAWLAVMTSVALACLDPFFAPSLGLMVRVPVVASKMPPPWPMPPSPPLPPLPPVAEPPRAAGRVLPGVAAVAADGGAAVTPVAADAAVGLVGGEVDGDAREGGGTGVEQAASLTGAGGTAESTGPAEAQSAAPAGAVGTTVATRAAVTECRRARRRHRRRRWPDC